MDQWSQSETHSVIWHVYRVLLKIEKYETITTRLRYLGLNLSLGSGKKNSTHKKVRFCSKARLRKNHQETTSWANFWPHFLNQIQSFERQTVATNHQIHITEAHCSDMLLACPCRVLRRWYCFCSCFFQIWGANSWCVCYFCFASWVPAPVCTWLLEMFDFWPPYRASTWRRDVRWPWKRSTRAMLNCCKPAVHLKIVKLGAGCWIFGSGNLFQFRQKEKDCASQKCLFELRSVIQFGGYWGEKSQSLASCNHLMPQLKPVCSGLCPRPVPLAAGRSEDRFCLASFPKRCDLGPFEISSHIRNYSNGMKRTVQTNAIFILDLMILDNLVPGTNQKCELHQGFQPYMLHPLMPN